MSDNINDRVERLQLTMNSLLHSSPVNLHSSLIVIAPRNILRLWMHAEQVVKTKRHFIYVEPLKLYDVLRVIDHQVVFIADSIPPDQRPEVLRLLRENIDVDMGHRMFLTMSEDEANDINTRAFNSGKGKLQ